MSTLLITQADGGEHRTPPGHPERGERLTALADAFSAPRFAALERVTARSADLALAETVHSAAMIGALKTARPTEGFGQVDSDTFVSPKSLEVASSALGAGLQGLEAVMTGKAQNAFCAVRPPGHHAERGRSMGFCLINSIAIVARQARRQYGVERVGIIDFDVHHGNGTQDIFQEDRDTFFGSSHQMPLYPGTGAATETGAGNIVNAPLAPRSGGAEMRAAYTDVILPALAAFSPDLILISAGFDAHRHDPLAQLNWEADDFAWLTGKLMDFAERRAGGRVVSMLEGGYDLAGLAAGAAAHVGVLMRGVAAAAAE